MIQYLCKGCGDMKDQTSFAKNGNGRYRISKCNSCRGRTAAIQERECAKNRAIARLINWRVCAVLVVGIFSHEVSDGMTRTCFYRSVYGMLAVTIPVTAMCNITEEFEI